MNPNPATHSQKQPPWQPHAAAKIQKFPKSKPHQNHHKFHDSSNTLGDEDGIKGDLGLPGSIRASAAGSHPIGDYPPSSVLLASSISQPLVARRQLALPPRIEAAASARRRLHVVSGRCLPIASLPASPEKKAEKQRKRPRENRWWRRKGLDN
ncbi:hypothetical protein Dimus_033057 [Dionaea muscipula]